MVECDNSEEFIIANLNMKTFSENLDLQFNDGEKICFKGSKTSSIILVEDVFYIGLLNKSGNNEIFCI